MKDPYAEVRAHFEGAEDVTVSSGRGAQGLKLGKRMFVMFYKGDLLITLPPDRVAELVASGEGLPFDPGTGKTLTDRVLIPASRQPDWIRFCEESRDYLVSR